MMDSDKLTALAKQWESDAVQYERRNKSINRSTCFDGKRQLNVGLAVASRAHADALRAVLVDSEAPALDVSAYPQPPAPPPERDVRGKQ